MKNDPIHLTPAHDFEDAKSFYDCDDCPKHHTYFCYLVNPSTSDTIHYAYLHKGEWTHHTISVEDVERKKDRMICERLLKDHRHQYPEKKIEETEQFLDELHWVPPVKTLIDAIDSYEPIPGTTCYVEDEGKPYEDWIAFVDVDGRWVKTLYATREGIHVEPKKQVTLTLGDEF